MDLGDRSWMLAAAVTAAAVAVGVAYWFMAPRRDAAEDEVRGPAAMAMPAAMPVPTGHVLRRSGLAGDAAHAGEGGP